MGVGGCLCGVVSVVCGVVWCVGVGVWVTLCLGIQTFPAAGFLHSRCT